MRRREFIFSATACVLSATAGASATFLAMSPPRYRWSKVASEGLSARDYAASFTFNGRVWIMDGYLLGGGSTGDLLTSFDGKTWKVVLEKHPFEKFTPIGPFKGEIWAVGGAVWKSADGVNFEEVRSVNPPPVNYHSPLHVLGGRMVIVNPHDATCYTSEAGTEWRKTTIPISPRWGAATAVFNGRVYIFAGGHQTPNQPPEIGYPDRTSTADVWSSDDPADERSWVRHTPGPWAPRMWPSVVEFEGRMLMSGGFNSLRASKELNFSDLWAMNSAGEWKELKVVDAPLGRHAAALFAHDGSVFMACGNTNVPPSLSSEIFILDRLILPQNLAIPTWAIG